MMVVRTTLRGLWIFSATMLESTDGWPVGEGDHDDDEDDDNGDDIPHICHQSRPVRSIETIPSFDQWSLTIENH